MTQTLKERLRAKSLEEGFAGFGVCRSDAVPELPARLQKFVD